MKLVLVRVTIPPGMPIDIPRVRAAELPPEHSANKSKSQLGSP